MPIMPFLLGLVTGSVITYVVKDKSSKQMLEDTGNKITSSAGAMTKKITSVFKKAEGKVEESAEQVSETVKDATQSA